MARKLRFGLFAISLLVAPNVFAQSKMRITINGNPAGTANYTQKFPSEGGKTTGLSLEMLDPGGRKVLIRQESRYDAKGNPVRMFQEVQVVGERNRKATIVTFDKSGANVILDNNGDRETKKIPVIETAPRQAASEFWFSGPLPKPGTTDKHYRFDLGTLSWQLSTTTYVGPKAVSLNKKSVRAHLLKMDEVLAYLDDQGLPLILINGTSRFERLP